MVEVKSRKILQNNFNFNLFAQALSTVFVTGCIVYTYVSK